MNPQRIKALTAEKTPQQALEVLNELLADTPDDPELLIARGKLLWSLGRRGESMSDYERAAAVDPDGPARLLIEHSNAIMDFFNPDLLNP